MFHILCKCAHLLCQGVPVPGVWTERGGREWRMFQENMTWSNAERSCQSYGGHLAGLESNQSRTNCFKRTLQTCFRDGPQISVAYVGLTNIFDVATYRWVGDNSIGKLGLSYMSEPNRGSRHCSTYTEIETLGFVNCSVKHPFICERSIGEC